MTAEHRVHAFGDDALGDLDATGIAELIRAGKISSAEAVDAAIERIERIEPRLNAVVVSDYSGARRAAAEPVGSGVFAGVPSFVKDNTDVRGLPTNHGTTAFTAKPAIADGDFGAQYLAQGFVNLGKTRLPEFGLNASTEFADAEPTRNPWHTDYSVGASSGGAAALVASGAVPIAHANDGGGSIRIPAAAAGLVGLFPTRGRMRAEKMNRSMPIKLVGEGVVTRSVRDTARFFAGAERYYLNPKLPPVGQVSGPGSTRLRVGVLLDSVSGRPVDDETRAAVGDAANLLDKLGHHVSEMTQPADSRLATDFAVYWGFLSFMIASTGRRGLHPEFDRTRLDGFTQGLVGMYRRDYRHTPTVLYRLRRAVGTYRRMFDNYDVVLSPVLGHTLPKLGHLSPNVPFDELLERLMTYVGFTPVNNVCGGPAISLPMAKTAEGLPLGLHFSALHGAERTLLELAYEIEQERPWRRITSTA